MPDDHLCHLHPKSSTVSHHGHSSHPLSLLHTRRIDPHTLPVSTQDILNRSRLRCRLYRTRGFRRSSLGVGTLYCCGLGFACQRSRTRSPKLQSSMREAVETFHSADCGRYIWHQRFCSTDGVEADVISERRCLDLWCDHQRAGRNRQKLRER